MYAESCKRYVTLDSLTLRCTNSRQMRKTRQSTAECVAAEEVEAVDNRFSIFTGRLYLPVSLQNILSSVLGESCSVGFYNAAMRKLMPDEKDEAEHCGTCSSRGSRGGEPCILETKLLCLRGRANYFIVYKINDLIVYKVYLHYEMISLN